MEPHVNPLTCAGRYLRSALGIHLVAFRQARADGDRGASAVELAVITAIILGVALALLLVIKTFVTSESNKIQDPGTG
jgi:Flp pilus assembly pilin Flp